MMFKGLFLCLMLSLISGMNKCPQDCSCTMDEIGQLTTLCLKGGMKSIPIKDIDPDVNVIAIGGPRNFITIGPIFSSFKKLEVLKIVESNIPAVGKNSFWGVKSLKILDLSKNNITTVTDENFRGQDSLQELNLSKNKISRMPSGPFCHLKSLRKLNLADNSIEELVQRLFYMLGELKYLDLSGNPLQDLPPEVFKDIQELEVLKCRKCHLRKINPQLYNLLSHLVDLNLGDNEFKYLDKDEFYDLKWLEKLYLDGNQLSVVVDGLFREQNYLQYLDLSNNRLAKVPNNAFKNLSNLTYIDLSYNKLVLLEPESVRHLINLETLNISGNIQMDLHEIRKTFEVIPNLKSLAVADLGILPMGFLVPFRQLRYLNISGNHLDSLSLQIINPCQKLEVLDLSRNQLKGINDEAANKIKEIRNVKLDNNPLICDSCHMGKLIDIVRNLQWENYPICFLPENLRGAEISDLNVTRLEICMELFTDEGKGAASTSHNILKKGGLNILAILGGVIFVLTVFMVFVIAMCFCNDRAKYYTNEETPVSDNSFIRNNTEIPVLNKKEISFKFPVEDKVCTIDELFFPPSPSLLSKTPSITCVRTLKERKVISQL